MIITTTPTLGGKLISQHLGVVTALESYTIGGLFGEGLVKADAFFYEAYKRAEQKLVEKASKLDANAIIGVQFTALGMDTNSRQMYITLMGTAVKTVDEAVDELPEL